MQKNLKIKNLKINNLRKFLKTMLNFSKSKLITILFTCLLALYFAAPSFIKENPKSDFVKKIVKILPAQKINLGLDLRGGSHLLMEVDFDYYLKEQINNLKEEIKSGFRDELIRTIPSVVGTKIIFSLSDEDQIKSAKKLIKKISKKLDVEEHGNQFEVYFSDAELLAIKETLIKQSIEIVRRRIDESGTKEPIIQAQGDNRILLQVPRAENSADNSNEIKSILGKTAKMTFHFVDDSTFANSNAAISDPDLERMYDYEGRSYLIKKEVILSGDLLVDANPTFHEGQPAVFFRFNDVGSRKFAQITKDNIGKFFAIILDGSIVNINKIYCC